MHRLHIASLVVSAGLLAGSASAQVQFFELDHAGFLAANAASPTVFTLDSSPNWSIIDRLSPEIDLTLVDIAGTFVDDHATIFVSGAFSRRGEVYAAAILPLSSNGRAGLLRFDFDPPVSSMGLWLYDDDNLAYNASKLRVLDTDGMEHVSGLVDGNPGSNHGVEGFVGVLACRGIVSVTVEGYAIVNGSLTPQLYAEADNIHVGSAVPAVSPPQVRTCSGLPVTLTASGVSPEHIVGWRKDGVLIDEETGLTLTLPAVGVAEAGFYTVDLTGASGVCGTASTAGSRVSVCPADFNCDGGVDGQDVSEFFALWEAGESLADVNADGGIDGADIGAFFAFWEAGGC